MLKGELVELRARTESDVPILHAELYEDIHTYSRTMGSPWQPVVAGPDSPYAVKREDGKVAVFSIVDATTTELVGSCLLWGIDSHSRSTHLGISLFPAARGKGFGLDVVRLLCRFAFITRGFQRVQLETLADNTPMQRTAERAGFTQEGRLRRSAWVNGEFLDEVIYGLLETEWRAAQASS